MLAFFILGLLIKATAGQDCIKRDYGNGGHVCVCNATYCDEVPRPDPVEPPTYLIYTSNKAGLRFQKSEGTFTKTTKLSNNEIKVNSKEKYQDILGWGGAFTDATGININSLKQEAQDKLLRSYFSEDGIEYSLCRVPIGGTDFSTRAYSYDDGDRDPDLKNFKLAQEDFEYKIPFIKKARDLTNGTLRLFGSVWTAPKWTKTNGAYTGFGFIRKDMYQTWADYFVKFLDKYQEQGLQFWGITTQNEPSLALTYFANINSVAWTPGTISNWIRNNLGPTIRNSSHKDIKIMILDDQRLFLPWFVTSALKDQITRNYVDGIAVHWYSDFFPPILLTATHNHLPDKFILSTEACNGDRPFQKHVIMGSWDRGVGYANDIIQDVQHWVTGWVDWNMALNLQGGPTYIDNFVDSPILVNATAGEFYKQPTFYHLGHFSKFVPRGSIRIGSSSFCGTIPVAAFRRPDNGTVVVILNKSDKEEPVTLVDNLRGSTELNLSQHSITTVLYW